MNMIADSNKQTKVRDYVTEAMRRGELRPGQRLDNDRVLSARLGVSRVTLGRGLNMLVDKGLLIRRVGSGTYVSEAAAKLNSHARKGKAEALPIPARVGFVVSDGGSPVAMALQRGMHQVFPKNMCDIVLKNPEGDPKAEKAILDDLVRRGMEALVAVTCARPCDDDFKEFYRTIAAKVPLVMCDCALYDPMLNVVSSDNILGGMMAADRLAGRAGKRGVFWILAPDFPHSSLRERAMGFKLGLTERWGVIPELVKTMILPVTRPDAVDVMKKRLRCEPPPDGCFALSEMSLDVLLDAASRLGVEVGKLNLCGYDNFHKTADLFGLPYLEQDLTGVGAEAARVLSGLLGRVGAPVRNVRIPPRWGRMMERDEE